MTWHIPILYIVIHVAIGFAAYYSNPILFAFLAYQVLQYAFNIRVFAFEGHIRSGNSFAHTLIKLGQTAVGYAAAYMWEEYKIGIHNNNNNGSRRYEKT